MWNELLHFVVKAFKIRNFENYLYNNGVLITFEKTLNYSLFQFLKLFISVFFCVLSFLAENSLACISGVVFYFANAHGAL